MKITPRQFLGHDPKPIWLGPVITVLAALTLIAVAGYVLAGVYVP